MKMGNQDRERPQRIKVTFSRAYRLKYAGCGVLDRCFTHPMLPWVVSEIKRKGQKDADTILLEVTHTSLRAIGCSRSGSISGHEELLFEHRFNTICKVAHYSHDRACFTYLIRECAEAPFNCHVFQATDEATVLELFATMREMTKGTGGTFLTTNGSCSSNTGSIASVPLIARMSGSVDSYSTNSQQFELLYVGKIKVSHKRAPPSFIDEAVDRFKEHEREMIKTQQNQQLKQTQQIEIQQVARSNAVVVADPNLSPVKQGGSTAAFNSVRGGRHRHGSGTSVSSLPFGALEELVNIKENELSQYKATTSAEETPDKQRTGKVKSQGDLPNSDLPDLHEGVLVPENIDEGISSTGSSGTDLSLSSAIPHPLIPSTQTSANESGKESQVSPGATIIVLPEISVPSSNSSLENMTSAGIHSLVTHTQSMDCNARESLIRDLQKCASQEEPIGSVLISPGSPSAGSPGSVQRLAVPSSVIGTELSSNDSGFVTHSQSLDITGRESLLRDLRASAIKPARVQDDNGSADNVAEPPIGVDRLTALNQRVRSVSGDMPNRPSKQTSLPPYRTRVSSGGQMDLKRRGGIESNSGSGDGHTSSSHQQLSRAMLLLIGKLDLCLIGTDMKQVMLRKTFSDISHCCKGVKQADHFGFICREVSLTQTEAYVGYVFRCQTKQVVDEIMQSLKQAFNSAHQAYQRQQQLAQRGGNSQGPPAAQMLCEACPMHWFHRLCVDLEGLPPDKVQLMILRRMKTLTEAEREDIMLKYQGAESDKVQEQNEIFMMLLRAQCEHKQLRHTHKHHTATPSNRPSKTSHPPLHSQESMSNLFSSISYGKSDSFSGSKGTSTFDNLRQKARQSLSNSFDSILKKRSKEDLREKVETPTSTNRGRLSKNNSVESTDESPKQQQNSQNVTRAETSSLSLERAGCVRETSLDPSHLSQMTSELADELDAAGPHRPRSSTFSGVGETEKPTKNRNKMNGQNSEGTKSPIMSIFMKVGNQNKSSCSTGSNGSLSNGNSPKSKDAAISGSIPSQSLPSTPAIEKSGPWRQTIFQRVQAPNPATVLLNRQNGSCSSNGTNNRLVDNSSAKQQQEIVICKPRSPGELRRMWKKAIMEQILLIRMEKENRKLQQNQDAASHKRMRLDYQEVTPCLKEAAQRWEQLLRDYDNNNDSSRCESRGDESASWRFDDNRNGTSGVLDPFLLIQAVKDGVPRCRRGDIWIFLANQQRLRQEKQQLGPWEYFDCSVPYDYGPTNKTNDDAGQALDCDYGEFLKQLTPHQHAILIDLGRTFPSHPFFAQPLGAGQLSLFNLLKAYSLLDPLVGYCQGLSFVAGVLLLHMSEEEAFHLMRHVLFRLGIRKQYKPDMVALQIQMYQLSRLIHDVHHDVHEHFEEYDIAPTLYAAPWFLTLFASQFPLGFVARLFDLIFVQGLEAVFKVALVLVGQNKERLLACHSFEAAMDFLKTSLPNMGIIQMERLFNQVFTLDISRQLHSYRVEYQVLQEEMVSGRYNLQNAHHTLSTQTSLHSTDASLQGGIDKKKYERLQQKLQAQEETTRMLEQAKKDLERKNYEVHDQLESSQGRNISLENQISSYQSTVKRLETRIRDLEEEREALLHSVNLLRKRLENDGESDNRRRSGILTAQVSKPQTPEPAIVEQDNRRRSGVLTTQVSKPQTPEPALVEQPDNRRRSGILITTQVSKPQTSESTSAPGPPKKAQIEDGEESDNEIDVRGRAPSLGALKVVSEGANIREELSIAVRKLSEQLSQQQEARLAEERKQAELDFERRRRENEDEGSKLTEEELETESQPDKNWSNAPCGTTVLNGITKGSIDVVDHPLKPA